jgi:hypothetical protein
MIVFFDLTGMVIWGKLGVAKKKATGILNHRWHRLYGICFMRITSFVVLGKKDVWVPAFAGIRIPDFYQHLVSRASPERNC